MAGVAESSCFQNCIVLITTVKCTDENAGSTVAAGRFIGEPTEWLSKVTYVIKDCYGSTFTRADGGTVQSDAGQVTMQ